MSSLPPLGRLPASMLVMSCALWAVVATATPPTATPHTAAPAAARDQAASASGTDRRQQQPGTGSAPSRAADAGVSLREYRRKQQELAPDVELQLPPGYQLNRLHREAAPE